MHTVGHKVCIYVNAVIRTTTNNAFEMFSFHKKTQMQMFVCQTNYCDFVTWTPYTAVIFRVKRDEGFLTTAMSRLETFWGKHIYPELRTRCREEKGKSRNTRITLISLMCNTLKKERLLNDTCNMHFSSKEIFIEQNDV